MPELQIRMMMTESKNRRHQQNGSEMTNPLLSDWYTPYETPPFHLIKTGHFKPAIEEAIKKASGEIGSITGDKNSPTFENTVAALDRCGEKLGLISSVLFNLNNAETSKELQAVAQEVSPLLARFSNDITLNEELFERLKIIYDSRHSLNLSREQMMLTEKKYRNFLLGGALLDKKDRRRFREISEELSNLSLTFEENVLEETNSFELHLTSREDLDGLPLSIVEMAGIEARKREKEGWIFTLHSPSYIPFMKYSGVRSLRETMLKAYSSRAFRANKNDNREIVKRIITLRIELAKLLGFRNFAEMALGDRMAETPARVGSFLEELFAASDPVARSDYENIKDFARHLGHNGPVERWDWSFYSEKLLKEKYNIDDEILKPFFSLEKVQKAVFELAGTLYGLNFKENSEIPAYHSEVRVWEVYDHDGSFLAILYTDYHPRPGKSGGAWMTSFREQKIFNGRDIRPLVSIVTNFPRPAAETPSLLTFNDLTTFLHEFGHAIHGVLSKCNYESLSGTNVPRDFVELPSQIMENFAYEKEWLDQWAVHYLTGCRIPYDIVQKIRESSTFNAGYACNRQLGFGFLDMAWHVLATPFSGDIKIFEKTAMARTELFPEIENTNMSCSFGHLFAGGYAAGYYGYKWAEVLDADAFRHFRETGIFNRETARSFRNNILEKGGSDKPLNLYISFRGKEPSPDALLERSGLKK
jgi:peptidyl-dipeptidase Dcp